MKKLTKQQIEALTNRISREYSKERAQLVEKYLPKIQFTKEEQAVIQLAKECDELKERRNQLLDTLKEKANNLGVHISYYYQLEGDTLKEAIISAKVANKYPVLTDQAITEDLLIRSIGNDFDMDTLILEYLNRLKNE